MQGKLEFKLESRQPIDEQIIENQLEANTGSRVKKQLSSAQINPREVMNYGSELLEVYPEQKEQTGNSILASMYGDLKGFEDSLETDTILSTGLDQRVRLWCRIIGLSSKEDDTTATNQNRNRAIALLTASNPVSKQRKVIPSLEFVNNNELAAAWIAWLIAAHCSAESASGSLESGNFQKRQAEFLTR